MVAFGFHYSIGGNKNNTGRYIARLNDAALPAAFKGTADAGLCFEAQEASSINIMAYRATNNATYEYDTPRYDLPPAEAAALHYEATAAAFPPELDRARVWMEPINEPRQHDSPNESTPTYGGMLTTSWLGFFMLEYALLANAAGFRVCGPSFNSGEPEPSYYSSDGMLAWLAYCAANPEAAALSVHEYNFASVPFVDNYPFHYGRFQAAIAAADKAGIARTFPILVTEFGWQKDYVPPFAEAAPTLAAYNALCAGFPQVLMAAFWTLQEPQPGWMNITNLLAAWLADDGDPLTGWIIANQLPPADVPVPTAPEFGSTLPKEPEDNIPMAKTILQSGAFDYPREPAQAVRTNLQRFVTQRRLIDGGGGWANAPEASITSQQIEQTAGYEYRIIVQMLEDVPEPAPPPAGFSVDAWPTDYKVITQAFGNNPEYYGQFGLPGHEGLDIQAPNASPIYCVKNGEVYEVEQEDGHNYGTRVRIRSGKYRHIYAHMLETHVLKGDIVQAGQQIGLADNTGNSFGSHLHITLKSDDAQAVAPDGKPGADYIGYPYEIIDPSKYFAAWNPAWPQQPAGKQIDFTPYITPEPNPIGRWMVFAKAAGGTIDHQMQLQNGIIYVVKSAAGGLTNYEELRISGGMIQRRYDTSPADGFPYKLDDGGGWSDWMPLVMTEGEWFRRVPILTRYDPITCQLIQDAGEQPSYIHFAKFHESYALPNGNVLQDVCELHWTFAIGGEVLERYFVAPGRWYVQWGNGDALHYLEDEPEGRAPLPLNPIACLD